MSSQSDSELIPEWARQRGLTRCFVYSGPSMRPTFRPGHLLYVRPDSQSLQPGDVLVFQDEQVDQYIVHRAVALTPDGWIMRGDNNRLLDAAPVPLHKIVGRVELADKEGSLQKVHGGAIGRWWVRFSWALRSPIKKLRLVLGWPYRALRGSPAARRWLAKHVSLEFQTIRLETPQGPLVKTLYRGRVVARWQEQSKRFECRKPFDLFIDPPY